MCVVLPLFFLCQFFDLNFTSRITPNAFSYPPLNDVAFLELDLYLVCKCVVCYFLAVSYIG